jgi:hypothetical protein
LTNKILFTTIGSSLTGGDTGAGSEDISSAGIVSSTPIVNFLIYCFK